MYILSRVCREASFFSLITLEVLKRKSRTCNGVLLNVISWPLQKKDVRMLRFIQEVNTTTRSCALWDLDEDTEYIVHVQSISMGGSSPPSEPVLFRTPKESEKMASKSPGDRRLLFFLVSRQPKNANMKAIYNISHPLTVFFLQYKCANEHSVYMCGLLPPAI